MADQEIEKLLAIKDAYEILGVAKDANQKAIKKAYRVLAFKYHPDQYEGDKEEAQRAFNHASKANEVLSKPEKRALYDKGGWDAVDGSGGSNSSKQNYNYTPPDLNDLAKEFGFENGKIDVPEDKMVGKRKTSDSFYKRRRRRQQNKPATDSPSKQEAMAPVPTPEPEPQEETFVVMEAELAAVFAEFARKNGGEDLAELIDELDVQTASEVSEMIAAKIANKR